MKFDKWFNKQEKLVQILLLLVPGLNWVVELLVRWSLALRTKNLIHILLAIVIIPGVGVILGWLDLIWVLLHGRLILSK